MFEIEQEIAIWRRQMIAGGIETPQVLDELESHLRDDAEEQERAGATAQQAFEIAVQRLGQAAALECEFEKVGETREAPERVKNAMLTLAGIPNQYLNEPMNTSTIEPRWATYLKGAAFMAPAVILWALSVVFVVPKLEQISADAGGHPLPTFIRMMISLARNGFVVSGALLLGLVLLEWRSSGWPRYRRAAIGFGAYFLNTIVLISIFMMVVTAIVLAPALMNHAK
jgi:hypothetical protein